MKILLVGEYSGVHNNLRKGLQNEGYSVKILANGDGYKNFNYDLNLFPFKFGRFCYLKNIFHILRNINKIVGYDIVQFIDPFYIPIKYFYILFFIFIFNKVIIYYVCGTDPIYLSSEKYFTYFPFDDYDNLEYPKYGKYTTKYFNWFLKKIDAIIPSMYSYYVGYKNNKKVQYFIPLPASGKYLKEYTPNYLEKIKILFGITRKHFKGYDYIISALNKIKNENIYNVEIIIVENLESNQYLNIMNNVDILVDQCKSYDYGMNAIFAMERGVIVLSGFEKESLDYFKLIESPIINITPNSTIIYDSIKMILDRDRDKMNKMKYKSVLYVNSFHNLERISKIFIARYQALLSKKIENPLTSFGVCFTNKSVK